MSRLETVVCLLALLVTVSTASGTVQVVPGGYDITLTAGSAARGVWIEVGGLAAEVSDNAFDMIGGESVTVHVTTTASPGELRKVLRVRSYYSSAT